jgi:hypothetical protein
VSTSGPSQELRCSVRTDLTTTVIARTVSGRPGFLSHRDGTRLRSRGNLGRPAGPRHASKRATESVCWVVVTTVESDHLRSFLPLTLYAQLFLQTLDSKPKIVDFL